MKMFQHLSLLQQPLMHHLLRFFIQLEDLSWFKNTLRSVRDLVSAADVADTQTGGRRLLQQCDARYGVVGLRAAA